MDDIFDDVDSIDLSFEGADEVDEDLNGIKGGGTALLREKILNGDFVYAKNKLFKLNFLNAKVVLDTNLSYYLNKKKSSGKIDMVAALVDSMALWETEIADEYYDGARLVTIF